MLWFRWTNNLDATFLPFHIHCNHYTTHYMKTKWNVLPKLIRENAYKLNSNIWKHTFRNFVGFLERTRWKFNTTNIEEPIERNAREEKQTCVRIYTWLLLSACHEYNTFAIISQALSCRFLCLASIFVRMTIVQLSKMLNTLHWVISALENASRYFYPDRTQPYWLSLHSIYLQLVLFGFEQQSTTVNSIIWKFNTSNELSMLKESQNPL